MTDTTTNDWNKSIVEEFRANHGVLGGMFEHMPVAIVTTIGARTGKVRTNPVAYQRLDDGSIAIFASKAGAPTNPDWFHNLEANPRVTVEVGDETYEADARVTRGAERDQIWARQKAAVPQFGEYEHKTDRVIPVVVLDRA
jgi:deazaflavin-dependent oxidoreductase (nitroreductase family)